MVVMTGVVATGDEDPSTPAEESAVSSVLSLSCSSSSTSWRCCGECLFFIIVGGGGYIIIMELLAVTGLLL